MNTNRAINKLITLFLLCFSWAVYVHFDNNERADRAESTLIEHEEDVKADREMAANLREAERQARENGQALLVCINAGRC